MEPTKTYQLGNYSIEYAESMGDPERTGVEEVMTINLFWKGAGLNVLRGHFTLAFLFVPGFLKITDADGQMVFGQAGAVIGGCVVFYSLNLGDPKIQVWGEHNQHATIEWPKASASMVLMDGGCLNMNLPGDGLIRVLSQDGQITEVANGSGHQALRTTSYVEDVTRVQEGPGEQTIQVTDGSVVRGVSQKRTLSKK